MGKIRRNRYATRNEQARGDVAINCWNRAFFAIAVFLIGLFSLPGAQAQSAKATAKTSTHSPESQSQGEVCKTEAVACPTQQPLIDIPKIESPQGIFKAVLRETDGPRIMPATSNCLRQCVRYFSGQAPGQSEDPRFSGTDPIPGPTLRMHVGDLAEITFWNQVNPQHFARTLDRNPGNCDTVNTTAGDWTANQSITAGTSVNPSQNNMGRYTFKATQDGTTGATAPQFPQTVGQTVQDNTVTWKNVGAIATQQYPGGTGDTMPNCLHGSTTTNLHFHGTHTTPSSTGDNVLLYIRPALRNTGVLRPSPFAVSANFKTFFDQCEKTGPPTLWKQMPPDWQNLQQRLLEDYDKLVPGQGLWEANKRLIDQGYWPQYQIGAYPYCFKLPEYPQYKYKEGEPIKVEMGQAPGTHWYHAHKHGSTALNIANGITGALIIEGDYDKDLHKFYSQGLKEHVMVVEELSNAPFILLLGSLPPISVNGRINPIVTMKQGEVQLWRIVNADFRDALEFQRFTGTGTPDPCPDSTAPSPTCINWRQIAQDGVQFDWDNYDPKKIPLTKPFNLAAANRADLLVKAPMQAGVYTLQVLRSVGSDQAVISPAKITLLTVNVSNESVNPPMDFIQIKKDFPVFPPFLGNIPKPKHFKELTFDAGFRSIDGKPFDPHHINQEMELNTDEEWTVRNLATNVSHPFHIHINPFQIVELFRPNLEPLKDANSKDCSIDPLDPDTWKPCKTPQPKPPYIWWDTFAIPTGRSVDISSTCTVKTNCPAKIQDYVSCSDNKCNVTIPGYFKMRSRFVDFTGQFVLHCHILIHEDRGMMQLIEVVTNKSEYVHD